MPELPEVETVRRGLADHLSGHTIDKVTLYRPNLRFDFPADLATLLEGQRLDKVERRAKYLIMHCGPHRLIAHLGMSGCYVIKPIDEARPQHKHDHMIWDMEGDRSMVYHDPRRFGFVLLSHASDWETHPMIAPLGVEPLSDACTESYLATKLEGRKTPIKTALMDQHIIAGIGNIYASELLFRAGIHPNTPAHRCIPQAATIIHHMRETLAEAIESGGSTLRNYANATGHSGYFQHRFFVYGRDGKPCFTCETPIERIAHSGRATFFCPSCQPAKAL